MQTIVIVDDDVANLTIARGVLKKYYNLFMLPSATILFELLENTQPDMILLDVQMPEMNGYQAIQKLKADPRFSDIPVIFLTSLEDSANELEGLSLGAIDYIAKPFSNALLLKRIENHLLIEAQKKKLENYNKNLEKMVAEKTAHILDMRGRLLNILANVVEFRDAVTGEHIERTQNYMKILVDKMIERGLYKEEMSQWDLSLLIPSSQLHDIGKITISDAILNKPGKLTPEEFEEMKKHAANGLAIIERIEDDNKNDYFLLHAKRFAGYHHEKWDGTGYPYKLAGQDIPLEGRLMAVVDVYDALMSARPYKEPMPPAAARAIILEGRGKHFDPALVDIFTEVVDSFEAIAMKDR